MANYMCKKFSLTIYSSARVHPLRTDRRSTKTMPVVRPLLKYGRLKTHQVWHFYQKQFDLNKTEITRNPENTIKPI